jgi:ornithine decarboxylase
MSYLKIAVGAVPVSVFSTERKLVSFSCTDFSDVGAAVLTVAEIRAGALADLRDRGLELPVFALVRNAETVPLESAWQLSGVIEDDQQTPDYYGHQIELALKQYEASLFPPFFGMLKDYVEMGNATFGCPGHHGGQFYRKHPIGRQFYEFYGETLFRSDLSSVDMQLGDLLIHEGAPHHAQAEAARVYHADKTYFVLNGTSASNKVVCNALLAEGDLVLFDRNNHKSVHHGALIHAGATPVYLETARNPFGFIGGLDEHCFDEAYLRERIAEVAPGRVRDERPFRLAVIQLGTYDGTIYNARQVVDKIGHLCDYILFDSAWVGYEQFIPMMKDCSPLLLELGADDPGIFVTQSVHKQQAGFSLASQIHKKDSHIKGQPRYCNHKRFNNAFMLHASTSPFYPLFAALDVNARMHGTAQVRRMWLDCVKTGIEARKMLLNTCKYIRPFVPEEVDGKKWQDYDTEEMARDLRFFEFVPGERWHAFDNYVRGQYFVDPCKLQLTTPGIDGASGKYADFGVPATILANFLREHGVVPEKCDMNAILFLLTPGEDMGKLQQLVTQIARFEHYLEHDAPMAEVLPTLYAAHQQRYAGYTLRQLCQEMHDLYKEHGINQLQRDMFRARHLPRVAMNPRAANLEFVRGHVELVPLEQAEGRTAAEGALPYPPGIICAVPGEVWGGPVWKYFRALEDGLNRLPGFAPELQGVYVEQDAHGKKRIHVYVLR